MLFASIAPLVPLLFPNASFLLRNAKEELMLDARISVGLVLSFGWICYLKKKKQIPEGTLWTVIKIN